MLLLSILMWVGSILYRVYSITKAAIWFSLNYKTYTGAILAVFNYVRRNKK